jgi:hypothetical protein
MKDKLEYISIRVNEINKNSIILGFMLNENIKKAFILNSANNIDVEIYQHIQVMENLISEIKKKLL